MIQDTFHRNITYIRLSVTDRCDFRCVYCMSEKMVFLPREAVLSFEELYQIAESFVGLGVNKIRLTGGEPLVRRGLVDWIKELRKLVGLEKLALTTNGSRLAEYAEALKKNGLSSVNISLDSLDEAQFARITRTGQLKKVLEGIDAAIEVGLPVKINAVMMKNYNQDEILSLVNFTRLKKIDCTFIEEMPLGTITEHERALSYLSSDEVFDVINREYKLSALSSSTSASSSATSLEGDFSNGGPARYFSMADSLSKIGFISPHSHNFCAECNRVRLTVEGRLLLCLGNEHSVDLKKIMRDPAFHPAQLTEAIIEAMKIKPQQHYFDITSSTPQIVRFMNMTGG